MEAVGVVLGAIALLDPVYKGLRGLHKAYQLSQTFDENLKSSISSYRNQEMKFVYHLELYIYRCKCHGIHQIHGVDRHKVMQNIKDTIETTVSIMNNCQELTQKYVTQEKSPPQTHPASAPSPPAPPSPPASPPLPPPKAPDGAGPAAGQMDSVIYAWTQARYEKVKKSVKGKLTSNGSTQSGRSGWITRISPKDKDQSDSSDDGDSNDNNGNGTRMKTRKPPPASPFAQAVLDEYRMIPQQKKSQPIRGSHVISWIDHGKTDFDQELDSLRRKNDELKDILKVAQSQEDPFLRIRASNNKSTMWKDTEKLRVELESLHMAIRSINEVEDDNSDGGHSVPLMIKVENNVEELHALMNGRRLCRTQPRERLLFSLSERPQEPPSDRFILATPVWDTPKNNMNSFPSALAKIDVNSQGAQLIGVATMGTTQHSHYHLQSLRSPEHIGGHSAAALAVDDKFKQPERLQLACRIAQAYLHFAMIHSFKSHGPLANYRLFGHEDLSPASDCWGPQVLDSVWADFGFGEFTSHSGDILTKADFQRLKIDPAVELGVLLSHLASGEVRDYEATAQGLDQAREYAETELDDKVQSRCGLYMSMVIKTCFLRLPGEPDKTHARILEEVAEALVMYTTRVIQVE